MSGNFFNKNSIFVIGFLIGFNIAFFYAFSQHFPNIYKPLCLKQEQKSNASIAFNIPKKKMYENWLKKQHMKSMKLNMDFYLHGPKFSANENDRKIIESEWLRGKVHITCVVFVDRINMIESIKNTWGNRCNKLYFFGNINNKRKSLGKSAIYFDTKIKSSWHHLCEVFNYVWKAKDVAEKLEWVIFVNEDTLIISENLRFLVAPLNFDHDYYLGHAITMWKQKYNTAQAGYVLSKGTLQKLTSKFNNSEKCANGGKFWKMEDFYLGLHLESLNIHPLDTRDSKLRGIFHGYSLQTLMWGIARPTNYWTKALFPIGSYGCCSPISVTFTVSESDKLYTLNYLFYYLHVHINLGIFGNKPAPTPIPEQDVWKLVLKEEFGLSNVTEMTNEQYYNIWRSMYSEPEDFMARNFILMPSAFKDNKSVRNFRNHPSMK